MLVNAPYKWDPLRRNVLGATPLDLAMCNHDAYLPVVWPLVMASSDVYKGTSTNPTLASLLLRPPITPLSQTLVGSDAINQSAFKTLEIAVLPSQQPFIFSFTFKLIGILNSILP